MNAEQILIIGLGAVSIGYIVWMAIRIKKVENLYEEARGALFVARQLQGDMEGQLEKMNDFVNKTNEGESDEHKEYGTGNEVLH